MRMRKVFTTRKPLVLTALIMAMALFLMMSNRVYAADDVGSGGTNFPTARSLSLGKTYTGEAKQGGVAGFFKFKTTGYKHVSYQIRGLNYTDGETIFNDIYDADGKKVAHITWLGNGKPDVRVLDNLERNRTYYIEMATSSYFSNGSAAFSIKVSQIVPKPGKAYINSAKAGKKKLTVKWDKVPYTTRYEVKYRKKGTSKWKTKTTTKTKITLKKLKKGKKYQVRIRAIRVVSGKSYKGAFSVKVTKKVN